MFDIIRMIVTLIFILVFAIIITSIVKVISEWSNNKQPILDINCKVVSKRNHTSVRAAYHDVGKLKFQGTRFLDFARQ